MSHVKMYCMYLRKHEGARGGSMAYAAAELNYWVYYMLYIYRFVQIDLPHHREHAGRKAYTCAAVVQQCTYIFSVFNLPTGV